MRLTNAAVVAILALGPSQSSIPGPPSQPANVITDPDVYTIYATVLFRARESNDTLLLQRETEPWTDTHCSIANLTTDPEWGAVEANFIHENAYVRLLRPLLPTARLYRLISRETIHADDARLAVKYPGIWQRRPESIEYAAISAVGFDWSRTKAIVAVQFRGRGDLLPLELRDGRWIAAEIGGCGGIA